MLELSITLSVEAVCDLVCFGARIVESNVWQKGHEF